MDSHASRLRRWQTDIWLRPTPLSAGVCRIAVAIYFAAALSNFLPWNFAGWLHAQQAAAYNPVGVLRLYGASSPPVELLTIANWLARVGVWFLVVGLFARLSLLVVAVSMLHLFAANYSFSSELVQTYVPGQVAAIGLLCGVRSPISVDYLIARHLRHDLARYWTTPRAGVLLTMFAVSWPLFNAAMYKVYLGNGHLLAWVYSDNLRNTLIFQWHKFQQSPPFYVQWIVERPWACHLVAAANVAAQGLPVLAVFLVRRPRLRLALALVVMSEIIGLGLLMNMWGGYATLWLPLVLFFPDWDAILDRRPRVIANIAPTLAGRRWLIAACIAYATVFVAISMSPKYRRSWYPCLPFSMFSYILAERPLSEHKALAMPVTTLEIDSSPPLTDEQQRRLFFEFHQDYGSAPQGAERARFLCQAVFGVHPREIRGYREYHVITAAPATVMRPAARANWFHWRQGEAGGHLRFLTLESVGSAPVPGERYRIRIVSEGIAVNDISFAAYLGADPVPVSVQVSANDDGTYELALPNHRGMMLIVVLVNEVRGQAPTQFFGRYLWPK